MASGSHDMTVRVWDAVSGKVVGTSLADEAVDVSSVRVRYVTSVAFGVHPLDGRLLVASGCLDGTVRMSDVISGACCHCSLVTVTVG